MLITIFGVAAPGTALDFELAHQRWHDLARRVKRKRAGNLGSGSRRRRFSYRRCAQLRLPFFAAPFALRFRLPVFRPFSRRHYRSLSARRIGGSIPHVTLGRLLDSDADGRIAAVAHDHHVGNRKRRFLFDNSAGTGGAARLRWRFTTLQALDHEASMVGEHRNTLPVLPRSRPVITITVSFFLIRAFGDRAREQPSEHLRRERDNL